MLTRKDFTKRANEFIQLSKNCKRNTIELMTIGHQIDNYCYIAKESNQRFDEQRFRNYIEVGIYGNNIWV